MLTACLSPPTSADVKQLIRISLHSRADRITSSRAKPALECGSSSYRLPSSFHTLPSKLWGESGSCCYRTPRRCALIRARLDRVPGGTPGATTFILNRRLMGRRRLESRRAAGGRASFRQAWRITNLLIKLRTLEGEEGSVDDYAGDPGAEAGPPPGGAPGFEPPAPHEPAAQDEGRSAGCSARHPVEARANRRAAPWSAVAAATALAFGPLGCQALA